MADHTAARIQDEIDHIEQLFTAYAELFARVKQRTPDLVELTALASVLHSFYTGIERIFLLVAKDIDNHVPVSAQWHRDLLMQMSQPTQVRSAVVSPNLAAELGSYLAFRHFYRHSYSSVLEWEELKELVTQLDTAWSMTCKAIDAFREGLYPAS